MNDEEGLNHICKVVADCLALEPEEVSPQSSLFGELGADSLDFVDLLFTLERDFGTKVGPDDLSFLTRLDLSDPEVIRDGVLTPAVVDRAREWLPGLADVADPDRLTPHDLWSLVTIETLWRVISRNLPEGD